jgi:hypothetical protein
MLTVRHLGIHVNTAYQRPHVLGCPKSDCRLNESGSKRKRRQQAQLSKRENGRSEKGYQAAPDRTKVLQPKNLSFTGSKQSTQDQDYLTEKGSYQQTKFRDTT